jgi:hypothetical protein
MPPLDLAKADRLLKVGATLRRLKRLYREHYYLRYPVVLNINADEEVTRQLREMIAQAEAELSAEARRPPPPPAPFRLNALH